MIIGVPKEIKTHEYRVAVVPAGVETLVRHGHKVMIQKGAGVGIGVSDHTYAKAGAVIVANPKDIFKKAEMIVKVKEPQSSEYNLLRPGQIVITYFHYASGKELTMAMIRRRIVSIAYETIQTEDGGLPCLTPMSEVAGKLAVQEGAKYLEKPMLGKGLLLGGVPGVPPCKVVILGGGVSGTHCAKVAAGMGARVVIMDINVDRLRYLDDIMPPNVSTLFSNPHNIRQQIKDADLLVGCVLIKGDRAPVLVTKEMIKTMTPGSVIVDVAIDQGGCIETSRPTTHTNPTYTVSGVVHYCVANMPGAVAGTSTYALTNVTLPYVLEVANKGYEKAIHDNAALACGVNMIDGMITLPEVAQFYKLKYTPLEEALASKRF